MYSNVRVQIELSRVEPTYGRLSGGVKATVDIQRDESNSVNVETATTLMSDFLHPLFHPKNRKVINMGNGTKSTNILELKPSAISTLKKISHFHWDV